MRSKMGSLNPVRARWGLLFLLLFLSGSEAAFAYDCDNGATVDGADENEATVRCNAFVQFKKRGEVNVDPAIERRIPPQLPNNREIRSFALVVIVDKYDNFPEESDRTLIAVRSDLPKIVEFLRNQNFDEIIVLHNETATVNNIRYFLRGWPR
jgi:hypothetical protein